MRRLTEVITSLRALHITQPKHEKALRHVHHGLHTSYLAWYSLFEWHWPIGIIYLGLLAFALASWIAPWLSVEEV